MVGLPASCLIHWSPRNSSYCFMAQTCGTGLKWCPNFMGDVAITLGQVHVSFKWCWWLIMCTVHTDRFFFFASRFSRIIFTPWIFMGTTVVGSEPPQLGSTFIDVQASLKRLHPSNILPWLRVSKNHRTALKIFCKCQPGLSLHSQGFLNPGLAWMPQVNELLLSQAPTGE